MERDAVPRRLVEPRATRVGDLVERLAFYGIEAQVPQHRFRLRRGREVRARDPGALEGRGDFRGRARVEQPPSKFFAHLLQELLRGPLVDRTALAVGQLLAVGAVERQDLVERGANGPAFPEAGRHAARVHERADRVGLDAVAVAGRHEGRARRPREARDGAVVDPVRAQVERERRGRPVPRRPRLAGLGRVLRVHAPLPVAVAAGLDAGPAGLDHTISLDSVHHLRAP